MSWSAIRYAACLSFATLPAGAGAATIEFSSYAEGTTFGSDLSIGGAVFSAGGGVLKIVDFGAGKALCASNGFSCTAGLSVTFAAGASNLAFTFSGDSTTDYALQWEGETPRLAFVGVAKGDGDPATTQYQAFDNSVYDGLDHIAFGPLPGNVVGFNSFSFTPTAAVPEPATWAVMLVGFAAIGLTMRRRRAALALRSA